MVITSRTRNAVVEFSAHGFESHPFRQSEPKSNEKVRFRFFVYKKIVLIGVIHRPFISA